MQKVIKRSLNKTSNAIRLLSIHSAIVLIAFFCSMALVVFLIEEVFHDKAFALDDKAFAFFGLHVNENNTSFFSFFTLFGSQYFLIPANLLLMGYAFFVLRDKWFGIKVAAVTFSSLFVMFALKTFFNRPRPEIPLLGAVPGLSFPSGHAFMSFTFFGLLIYVINKQVKKKWLKYLLVVLCFCMIIVIGLSRIYLRVHYASDVMAGVALGLMWLVISLGVLNYIEKRARKKNTANPVEAE